MANGRIEMHRLQELVRLHRMKTTAHEVARLLRMSPNTERQYRRLLQEAALLNGPPDVLPELEQLRAAVLKSMPAAGALPAQQTSSIEPWMEHVVRLMDKGLRPRAIYDRLRLEHEDFRGSHSAVKRLYRSIVRARGVQAKDVAIPVETPAGEIAQVDFGYVGKLLDPESRTLRRAWCFVLVLGFSRHMVVRIVFDQKTETWLSLHIEAFAELGGRVETVVPDNLKAAVLRTAFGLEGESALNRSYRELARHYGFKIDPTPPRDPRKKGKVESGVKYVKKNFFRGRDGSDVVEVRRELSRWVRQIAGMRDHGTTHRRPIETFEEVEKAALEPLPLLPFEIVVWKKATVHPDTHIVFDRRLYSVPWRLSGHEVWVRATRSTVTIWANDERVATHERNGPGYRSTIEAHLPDHRRDLRHRTRSYWEKRADALGPQVGAYIREVFDSDDVLSQLRAVQAMVTHLETFPVERARGACARASYYGNYTVRGLKAILKKALDLEPLPTAVVPTARGMVTPRFARKASELLQLRLALEVSHEPN